MSSALHLRRRAATASIALVVGLVALGGLASCAAMPAPKDTSAPEVTSSAAAQLPLWVAVVGDSNTTGFATTLDDGIREGVSWIAMVPQTEIKFAGGWARSGATSTAMLQHVSKAPKADVVVIMAGTNDLAQGLSQETLDEDVRKISAKVGAKTTVISAIAPFDARPEEAIALNAHLLTLATAEGWLYVDPWKELRTPEGKWVEQFHRDGLHTTKAGYQVMAYAMRDELLDALVPGAKKD